MLDRQIILHRLQRAARTIEMLANVARLENPQPVRRRRREQTAPRLHVHQRVNEMQEQFLHVALVFDRLERQRLLPRLRLGRQRFRGHLHGGLNANQPPHLLGQFGNFEPLHQVLPLDGELPHDGSDLLTSLDKRGLPLVLRHPLRFGQQIDNLRHFVVHEMVEAPTHQLDVAVDFLAGEAVLVELPKLHVEHSAQQIARHRPRPLLVLLLPLKSLGFEHLSHHRPARQTNQADQHNNSIHGRGHDCTPIET